MGSGAKDGKSQARLSHLTGNCRFRGTTVKTWFKSLIVSNGLCGTQKGLAISPPLGGKTAFVHDESFVLGIGKMFQAFSMMRELPFEVQTFKSINEATAWLGV